MEEIQAPASPALNVTTTTLSESSKFRQQRRQLKKSRRKISDDLRCYHDIEIKRLAVSFEN
jgi:hypothetical protein